MENRAVHDQAFPLTEEQKARAVEIADARCRSDVEVFGKEVAGQPGCYALTDSLGVPVRTFKQAGITLQEAFGWLSSRGLASLRIAEQGAVIQLHLERFRSN